MSSTSEPPAPPEPLALLAHYWAKRDFSVTTEPRGETGPAREALVFVVQKHHATRLHYDFRLELGGVLVSWAVPKGPSLDPTVKRMGIHVEDHPLSYAGFEGTIPPKHYGAGTVIVWDTGTWTPTGDPAEGLANGKLVFSLQGHKLGGTWELVKIAKPGERQEPWLLFKKRDAFARPSAEFDVTCALPDSVIGMASASATDGRTGRVNAKPADAKPADAGRAEAQPGGARRAKLPATLAPQLATLANNVPAEGDWSCELKFDGYRIMARIDDGRVALVTRGGHDWAARLPELVDELPRLGLRSGWLDGEIVVLGDNGAPDFNALQKSFDGVPRGVSSGASSSASRSASEPASGSASRSASGGAPRSTSKKSASRSAARSAPNAASGSAAIVYYVFDLPFIDGLDLRALPLTDRRARLQRLLADASGERVRFSAEFDADVGSVLASACRLHMEGVIVKRRDAPYVSRRSESWLKLKCRQRQEFVVCGYTDRSDGAAQIGSLVLGVHEAGGRLVAVGSVGTGWTADDAAAMKRALADIETTTSPFAAGPAARGRWSKRAPGAERWVRPEQVVEVEFAGWTPDHQLRHASWLALRDDKPANTVVREVPIDAAAVTGGRSASAARPDNVTVGGVTVSHAGRVIDAASGLTKLDLVRYYEAVASWILPQLIGRPCSLVRAPNGVAGTQFFQKHTEGAGIEGILELDRNLWPAHAPLLEVPTAKALIHAAQMNVVEFHTWNARARQIDRPDRMIFDLDPGEHTPWPQVQESALLVREMLTQLGLRCWLKTSGGKGLHVVVPLNARFGFDTVKAFSRAIVQHLASVIPSHFVAVSGPSNRVGRLFVDYLRNGHNATTAAAYSARARPGLGVSMPVSWDDLPVLTGGNHWTIATAVSHLAARTEDPWADVQTTRQGLTAAMKVLGFVRPASVR